MTHVLIHLAALAAAVLVVATLLPSVRIRSAGTAALVAVVFSVLNLFLGWLIKAVVLALMVVPGVLTLGLLFLFVPLIVNAVLLWLTDKALTSFQIRSLGGLFITSLAITLVNWAFSAPNFGARFTHSHWV
jgi:putative membrane protein